MESRTIYQKIARVIIFLIVIRMEITFIEGVLMDVIWNRYAIKSYSRRVRLY